MKAALLIMAIVFIFTAASFILSMSFTQQNMTESMEHELRLALDIADSLVSTKIELLKSNAANISDHLLRVDSDKEMMKVMSFLLSEYTEFLSLTVLNKNGIITNYGQSICSKTGYDNSIHFKRALDGEIDISSTHYDEDRKRLVMHIFVPMNQDLVLSATIPAMILSNLISDFKLWNTGNIFIVDEEATVIANVRIELVYERYNFIEKARNNPDVSVRDTGVFFRNMINTDTGSGTYHFSGQDRLCVYKRVSSINVGWHIGVVAPINESPLQRVQKGLLLASLIFLVIGAIVSIFVSGIAIKPFKKIQEQNKDLEKLNNEINQKSNLLDSMNKAANILLQSESSEFENNLQLSMCMIGKAVDADRVCIWKNSVKDGKLHCTMIDEWIANERMRTSSEISTDIPYEGNIPTFERILTKGECINSLTRDLSPEEQARMNMHGVKSIFVAPVFVHDEFWGFVGCDNCHDETVFPVEVATTLRSGSLLIANALLHNEMTLDLQKTAAELKTALMDTQKANNAKSDFLASMSHEMRTPLNAVIGLSELVLEDNGISKTAETNLEKIYSAGETLLSLVNDILDISKIEAGKFELIESEYHIPSLINDTITNNILRIGEKPIEFILDIRDDLPAQLYGDELRIKQILSNLLSNAFKYTKEGTVELGIDCIHEEDVVWLKAWVRDSGIGIKPEDVRKLFSNYTQMDIKANRSIEGTGLGLPIAKKMAELMDGIITVESEYGKGSTFTVKIKQKHVADTTIGPEVAKSLKSFQYSTHRRSKNAKFVRIKLPYACVLVVDDNVTNLDVAKGLMKPYGMQIDTVTSGQQAIDAIRMGNIKYNAIFMDHMMPGMDGIEAAERIREIGTDYAKDIPIIALTANAIAGNEKMFLSKGFQDFLSKPIDISRLDAVIRRWIRDKSKDNEETSDYVSNNQSSILKYQINGIDLKAGLERFSGDGDAYLQVLRSYAANIRNLLDSIKEVNKENLNDYTITVHGIKGSSRNINANLAGDIAEALEKAAKEGDLKYVCEKTPDLVQTVSKLLEDLDKMFIEISAKIHKPSRIKPDKDVLVKILEACYTFNMETVEKAVKELESYEYETNGELVHWLWENVQQFNVNEIIRKLSEMNLGKDYL